ncbi:hypothetical protein RRV45_19465 [Bacillus sp. DTU_2020_1000418_1_SI_GHA_SEK_038]|uniref:hypothetical protein n=1 Tax=Bacillus sp. DTU_2020_1000418_1_SI_GHA_SEK_038 TaxID=3077585 RepID=UPI0028E3D8F2|nr:hypothetical protein [Bacillus sp. DTU_2020_1000418_1_SI_GHA_SEK_038]WNS75033.1 hypothetical protein RRV45_19465 [Bacillus sp. DTU_2020_1000418_1_SI_GHA_SEK_038]
MSRDTKNVILLVLGLILVALSRFPIMSQSIAILVGVIGAIVIIISAILIYRTKKSKNEVNN